MIAAIPTGVPMPASDKDKCPYIVKQGGKILHCIKRKGHPGPHQHRGEGKWYKV